MGRLFKLHPRTSPQQCSINVGHLHIRLVLSFLNWSLNVRVRILKNVSRSKAQDKMKIKVMYHVMMPIDSYI